MEQQNNEHLNTNEEIEKDIDETKVSPYLEEKEMDLKEDNAGLVTPNHTYKALEEFIRNVNQEDFDKFSETEKLAIGILADSIRNVTKKDMLKNALNKDSEKWLNNVSYGDVEINIRNLELKAKPNKEIKGKSALLKIRKSTKRGSIMQIPLWHSGFHITLAPIGETELVNLELELSNEMTVVGRETQGLAFANTGVIYNRIISNFFVKHIQDTTLNLTKKDNILDYIKMQDLNIILLALVTSMYPKGYNLIRSCVNSIKKDEEGKPKCNFVLRAKIDPRKVLWVNKSLLTSEQLIQMSKKIPNTISKEEVKEYQKTLATNKERLHIIKDEDGKKLISIKIKTPSLKEHIEAGEYWVNYVSKLVNESLTDEMDDEDKENLINNISKMTILGTYNHYVSEILTADNEIIRDRETIDLALMDLSEDAIVYNQILNVITKYINNNVLALAAMPVYECPTCNELQPGSELNGFNNLIPLNMLESFFDLRTLKLAKVMDRLEKIEDI